MVVSLLFVEGGGDAAGLKAQCREGFSTFLKKAGMAGRMPRIVACGSRREAYEKFCVAARQAPQTAMLLVDSEGMVKTTSSWDHLKQRPDDRWEKPEHAKDDDCHLMVQCMESWFLADRKALAAFYGQGFNAKALPAAGSIETIQKTQRFKALAAATKGCKTKAAYGRGRHSFQLLPLINPENVVSASIWAARFMNTIRPETGE